MTQNFAASGKHVRKIYTPLNPTFIQKKKLGLAGVFLILLILIQNINFGYSSANGSLYGRQL